MANDKIINAADSLGGVHSNEIQALGLKKKSEYKSPSKKKTP